MLRKDSFLTDQRLAKIFNAMAPVALEKSHEITQTLTANNNQQSVFDAKMNVFRVNLADKTSGHPMAPLAPIPAKQTLDLLSIYKGGAAQMTYNTVTPSDTVTQKFRTSATTAVTADETTPVTETPVVSLIRERGKVLPFIRPAGAA